MDEPPVHVTMIAIPDAMASTMSGIYDVMTSFEWLATYDAALPRRAPFEIEIASSNEQPFTFSGGLALEARRTIEDIDGTDVVIVPSMQVEHGDWRPGRYPELITWLRTMHERGATLCSACSGVLLLAETGLLDGREATMHWMYARTFEENFPEITLKLDKALVAAGDHEQIVMSGASTSWHDLVLYLIARYVGTTAAQSVARYFALQWHREGLAPYVVFSAPTGHGDAIVEAAQSWLDANYASASPVEEMVARSGLPERSFKRRFRNATGYSPIAYAQQLRVEDAKRRLERTDLTVDEISWRVGYEDPAFFRRLFKRLVGLTPGAYRRRFQVPGTG